MLNLVMVIVIFIVSSLIIKYVPEEFLEWLRIVDDDEDEDEEE